MISDWRYQHYYHRGYYLLLLERNSRTKEVIVSTRFNYKVRWKSDELYAIACAILEHGESLHALLDWLLEWDGWANEYDRIVFRSDVIRCIEQLQVSEYDPNVVIRFTK